MLAWLIFKNKKERITEKYLSLPHVFIMTEQKSMTKEQKFQWISEKLPKRNLNTHENLGNYSSFFSVLPWKFSHKTFFPIYSRCEHRWQIYPAHRMPPQTKCCGLESKFFHQDKSPIICKAEWGWIYIFLWAKYSVSRSISNKRNHQSKLFINACNQSQIAFIWFKDAVYQFVFRTQIRYIDALIKYCNAYW